MTLNPNKTKAIVVSRSRTVNPPHGDLVLFGVSISDTPKAHLQTSWAWYCVSRLAENWYIEVIEVCLCGHQCNFVAIMHLFSQSASIVLRCGDPLLTVIFSISSARCVRQPGCALITFLVFESSKSCCWTVHAAQGDFGLESLFVHSLLLPKLDIPELLLYLPSKVECFNSQDISCFPTLCYTTER